MGKVLIVDDDCNFVESTRALLEENGYSVISAQNGSEGYEKATKEKPSLMLLDVMMTTEGEGFEIARKLKENPRTRDIPVIIITGIRRKKALPFSYEPDEDWLPVKAVMEKPVEPEKLLETIKQIWKGS